MALAQIEITAPADTDWAERFGRELVAERLAASANVIHPMRSVYWWQGKIEDAPEALLVLNTRAELVDQVLARVLAEHPYEVPGVRVFTFETHESYRQWLLDETQPPV